MQHQSVSDQRWNYIRKLWQENIILYAIVGFLLGILAFPLLQRMSDNFTGLIHDLVPEGVGMIITVLIIDRIYRHHETKRFKAQLIREMGNKDAGIAERAVRELWSEGWLFDGSLRGKNFVNANLEHLDLSHADLQRALLFKTNLRNTDLTHTNLLRARLMDADLTGAQIKAADMRGTELISANLQGASLAGANLQAANLWLADLREAVLVNTDLRGANLADANLQGVTTAILLGKRKIGMQFDEKTVLPDSSYWTPDTDIRRFIYPDREDFWRSDDPNSPAYRENL